MKNVLCNETFDLSLYINYCAAAELGDAYQCVDKFVECNVDALDSASKDACTRNALA